MAHRHQAHAYHIGTRTGLTHPCHIGTRTGLTAPTSAPVLAWLRHAVGPQILSIVSLLSIDSVFFTPPSKRQLVEQVKQRFASLEGVCSPGADVASPDPVAGVAAASPVPAQMWQRVRWHGRPRGPPH